MNPFYQFLTLSLSFICLAVLPGCAALLNGPFADEDSDYARFSQSAPDRSADPNPASEDYHRTYVSHAIDTRDIVPGMTEQEVVSAWGRPREVDVAGDGSRGNERWMYFNGNSLHYGVSQQRIVYFEGGRVAGWETR